MAVEKSKTSLQVERIKLDSVQNGTDDEIHNAMME